MARERAKYLRFLKEFEMQEIMVLLFLVVLSSENYLKNFCCVFSEKNHD